MIKKSLTFIMLVGILASFAGKGLTSPLDNKQAQIYYDFQFSGKLPNGSKFELFLTTKAYSKNIQDTKFLPKEGYRGTDGENPVRVIDKIDFTLGGKTIDFPKETFADLGNITIRSLNVVQNLDKVILHMSGGEGLQNYTVFFHIKRGKLVSRTLMVLTESRGMDFIVTKFPQ